MTGNKKNVQPGLFGHSLRINMTYLLLFLILYAGTTHAEWLKVGTIIPVIRLNDQHGQTRTVNRDARLILFCKDRKAQDIISQALDQTKEGYLTEHNTVYIADTSGIPRLVAKFIAFPALRKKPYTILLDKDSSVTKFFPSEKDRVTLLYANDYIIHAIAFADDPESILKSIHTINHETIK